jgi:hypothetical protein
MDWFKGIKTNALNKKESSLMVSFLSLDHQLPLQPKLACCRDCCPKYHTPHQSKNMSNFNITLSGEQIDVSLHSDFSP